MIIKLFIFSIAILAALESILKVNCMKPDFHEFLTKGQIFRKQLLPLRNKAKKRQLRSFNHSLPLVQEDLR